MKKIIALTALALVLSPSVANARTHISHYKPAKVKIAKYGYTYHRLATVKCPYFGCRRNFSHK